VLFVRKLFSLIAVVALGTSLAACGGSDDKAGGNEGGDDAGFGKAGVKVTESFGKKPTITHREGAPDTALVTEVLAEGDGTEVKKGDLLTAHYIGQIWRDGKVFDNSYDRGAPASFPIGVGGVVPGWDEGLVGKKLGSRVLLSIPPDKGYKAEGNDKAGIKGDDTLIFVVDLVGSSSNTSALDAEPQQADTGDISVSGDLNAEPKVTVAKGAKAAATPPKPVVLAKGKGEPIKKGDQLVGRYVIYDYTGKKQFSTWDGAPQAQQPAGPTDKLQVGPGPKGEKGPLDALADTPIGSRVLVYLAPQKDQKGKTITAFAVMDVLNAFPAPKQQ
jgi:peptidylprolyl isomerase